MESEERAPILLVDDNPANLIALEAVLRTLGQPLVQAQSGEHALRRVMGQEFAVILLDVSMPEMDGFETAALLRQHPRAEHTPIIFVTAINNDQADLARGYALGAVDYLFKPLVSEIVQAKVAALVDLFLHKQALHRLNDTLEQKVRARTGELVASEARFRLLCESAPVGILMTNAAGECSYANPRWGALAGLSPEESLARSWPEAIYGEDRESVLAGWRQAMAAGHDWRCEYRLRTQEGRLIWVSAMATPLSAPDEVLRVVHIVEDITARKRSEEVNAKLEAQLRQSQKLEAIGTLAGGIAHDFNNLLNTIVGNTELAKADLPSEHPVQDHLSNIYGASLRAADLVRQILSYSRPDKQEHHMMDPVPVVKEALKLLRATLPATVDVHAAIAPDCPLIWGNPTQVYQVIMNLYTNAWQAMNKTGGHLDITVAAVTVGDDEAQTHPDLHEGRYVCLSVRDNGHGMDQATLQRIFEPFFTTKGLSGSGLGLSVVYGIMKGHDGAVRVESQLGEGSCFLVYFPAQERSPCDVLVSPAIPSRSHGQQILFVDDEQAAAKMVPIILQRLGYQVAVYTNPMSALFAFRDQPDQFDLVITDLTMPGMTGEDLAEQLLQIRPDLPIILCSGYGAAMDREEIQQRGIRELLSKPYTKDLLDATIRRVLAGSEKNLGTGVARTIPAS